ncbi:Cro/Cl family transcriptional regulator [Virgibacillus sp. CM-4]|uniref:helix-turn-helix domain-containing protein n=1 Tax=Virgibacillus sp. CM-4 TaxID=1354277 RepID=UPI000388731F|nr:helix-turn-helix transcriptional regulator [Virgibacillus sp. CM-4]EQB34879.1 Cro/Cl family transcriptional regulator [Virgibacillus sp. CM-4]
MSLVERIKKLCDEKKVSFAEVERSTGISNGQIRRWDKSSPKIDNVTKVANYFDVSTDYLLGRTDEKRYYDLTDKDERDIEKDLERIINSAESDCGLASFDGKVLDEMDEEDRDLYISSLKNALRMHKRLAKKKFTPKKYR